MYEFFKKRRIVNTIFAASVLITLSFMLIAPLFGAWFKENMRLYSDASLVLIVITVATTFAYSRYKKASAFVNRIAAEINDCGAYITALKKQDLKEYETAVYNNLSADFYKINSNVQLSERDFSFKAEKKKNTLYFAKCKKLTKDDFFAYSDAVNFAAAASNVRQKQTVVMCIAAEKVEDEVLAYTKMTTALGKIMIYPLVVDLNQGLAYFFQDNSGNLNFALKNVLNYPEGRIPEELKKKEQLPFQKKLERKMLLFTIKEYNNGKFNPRS